MLIHIFTNNVNDIVLHTAYGKQGTKVHNSIYFVGIFFLNCRENIPEIESPGVRAYFKVCLDHELFTLDS